MAGGAQQNAGGTQGGGQQMPSINPQSVSDMQNLIQYYQQNKGQLGGMGQSGSSFQQPRGFADGGPLMGLHGVVLPQHRRVDSFKGVSLLWSALSRRAYLCLCRALILHRVGFCKLTQRVWFLQALRLLREVRYRVPYQHLLRRCRLISKKALHRFIKVR